MVWAESLARSGREVRKAYRSFLKQFAGSRPIAEALEARVMMSVVPVADTATELTSISASKHAVSAVAADGSVLVAWDEYDSNANAYNVYYNVYDSNGVLQLYTPDSYSTGQVSDSYASVSGLDVAVNSQGQAVLGWVGDGSVHVGELEFLSPYNFGWDDTVPSYTIPSARVKVAMDDGGDVVVGWEQGSYQAVQATAEADPSYYWLNAVYVDRFNASSYSWLAQPVKVSIPTVAMDHGSGADDFDVAMNSSGGFVVGWDVTNFDTRTIREASGSYTYGLRGLSVDTFFQRYGVDGDAIGSKVSVAHHVVDDSYADTNVTLAMDASGAFTFVTKIRDGYSNGHWLSTSTFAASSNTLYRRSFDQNGGATTGEIQVAHTDATSGIPLVAAAYDQSHQLLLAWVAANNGTPELHLQMISATGSRTLSDQTLNGYSMQAVEIRDLQLLVSDHGIGIGYFDGQSDFDGSLLSGTYYVQPYIERAADLSVTIGETALLNDLATGNTASGDMPIVIKNVGNADFDGSVTLHVVLSGDDVYGDTDDVALQGSDLTMALKLKAGASKTITLADLMITPDMYMPFYNSYSDYGSYNVLAHVTTATVEGAAVEVRAGNNVGAQGLLVKPVVGPDPTVPALTIKSTSVSFSRDVLVPGDTGSIVITIQNTGTTDIVAQETTLYVAARPTLWGPDGNGGDAQLISYDTTLSLKAGATKTYRFRLNLNTDVLPDDYYIATDLTVPMELPYYPYVEPKTIASSVTSQTWKVLWEFGHVDGRAGNTVMRFKDSDGGLITYSMSGKGYATLDTDNTLRYFDTTSNTNLSVTTKNWSGSGVGSVEGYSAIGKMNLASQSPASVYLDAVRTLYLSGMSGGVLNIRTDSTEKVNIALGLVEDLELTSTMAIRHIVMTNWMPNSDKNAGITAPTIDLLETQAAHAVGVGGDFDARLALSGVDNDGDGIGDYGQTALKSAVIRGELNNGVWNIQGGIGTLNVVGTISSAGIWASGSIESVRAAELWNAGIMAGVSTYDPSFDSSTLNYYVPTESYQFRHTDPALGNLVSIGSVTLTNRISEWGGGDTSNWFYIAAAKVGRLSLGNIDTSAANDTFGVVTLEPATSHGHSFASISFHNLDTQVRWTPATKDALVLEQFCLSQVSRSAT